MKIKGFNLFKMESSKQPANPLSQEGVKALVIVLVVIILISASVYFFNIIRQSEKEPGIFPTTTKDEITPQPRLTLIEIPTVTPTVTGTDGLTATPTEASVEVLTEELTPTPDQTPVVTVNPTVVE